VGGGPLDCDDGNVCTDDSCDPGTGCQYVNNTAPCDDGLFCTTGEICSLGVCAGALSERQAPDVALVALSLTGDTAGDCDTNDCVIDVDDDPDFPDGNWVVADSNNATTEIRLGFPTPSGIPSAGADLQEFRAQVREFGTGQTGTPLARIELWENGTLVRAGLDTSVNGTNQVLSFTWNANELANPDGSLVEIRIVGTKSGGPPAVRNAVDIGAVEWNAVITSIGGGAATDCSFLDDACNVGVCNEVSDSCETQPANEGLSCDDGAACLEGETCQSGTCTGGAAPDCSAFGDQCNTASCDPAGLEGNCDTLTPANEGLSCDDGAACLEGETCQSGTCSGGAAPDCSAVGDQCNTASCDPVGAEGNCDTLTAANEGLSCDDGDACTQTDSCASGACVGADPVLCDDGNVCTIDSCDSANGSCIFDAPAANGLPCDDGISCTVDACSSGACVGTDDCPVGELCDTGLDACIPSINATLAFDSTGCSGADVVVPITIDSVDGVLSMDLVFTYDPAVLQATAVYQTPLTDSLSMTADIGTPGAVDISMSGASALTGSGEVAWVVFTTVGAAGIGSDLVWVSQSLNGGAIPLGGNDGRIDVIGSSVSLSMPDDAVGAVGSNVFVPVVADPADGLGVNLTVEFNPDVLQVVNVTNTTISQTHTVTYNDTVPGKVAIALFGTTTLSGVGPIVEIEFQVLGSDWNVSPLNLTQGDIDEGSISSCLDDGLFVVCDCDDGNVCTADSCDLATQSCVNDAAANDGVACDDGDACTENDLCSGGVCGGGAVNCDDGNVCTNDACDAGVGCVYTNNTSPCDDGNACTDGDACAAGACVSGGPLDCDDGNVCTNDACDSGVGCVYTNNTSPCDDGDACTVGDSCAAGACVSGGPLGCDDGNVCTNDACDSGVGCVYTNNTSPCDDGDACTMGDSCAAGACVSGGPLGCDDGNVCTNDACDSGVGCVYTNNTDPCSDGVSCTTDVCSGGSCVGTDICPVDEYCDFGLDACALIDKVTLPFDATGCSGSDVVVPITVDSVDGVLTMDLEFTYDPAVLQAAGVYQTPLSSALTMTTDLGVPGTVDIAMTGATPLTGSGDVAWVVFTTVGAPGTGSDLIWVNNTLNAGGVVSAGVNGRIDVISSMVQLRLPDNAVGTPGSNVRVPLFSDPADGLGLDLTVEYNPDVLQVVDVHLTPISQNHALTFNGPPGMLMISMFGTTPLAGVGAILEIEFQVIGADGDISPLNLTRGEINEGEVTTCLDDGKFKVCDTLAPEATGVQVGNVGATVVTWDDLGPGFLYDLVSGTLADLHADDGVDDAQCEATDTASTSYNDPRPDPLVGEGYYYVIRSQNACGEGTLGLATSGVERLPTATCP
jgi:hypothetical protein